MNHLSYTEYAPDPDLLDFIHCYYTMEYPLHDAFSLKNQRMLPLGNTELVIIVEGSFWEINDSQTKMIPQAFILGQQTRYRCFVPGNTLKLFSVVFKPFSLYFLLKISAKNHVNELIPVSTINSELTDFCCRLRESKDNAARKKLCDSFFTGMFLKQQPELKLPIRKIIQDLYQVNALSPKDAAQKFCISLSKLERNFKDYVGITYKHFHRIIRFSNLINLFPNDTSWNHYIFELGYFDQPHFIKEFKEFTGLTPNHYFKAERSILEKTLIPNADFLQYK
ncbi:MAG: helix-turn-helix domain-containing protein [Spirochaetes bacterium]|nr:helix-turn-helix domain-containing protein [Spirochaetota bacterium]